MRTMLLITLCGSFLSLAKALHQLCQCSDLLLELSDLNSGTVRFDVRRRLLDLFFPGVVKIKVDILGDKLPLLSIIFVLFAMATVPPDLVCLVRF